MTNVWSPATSNPSAIAALGGDVTGTVGANTVVKLRGRAIAATAPTDGQVYQYVAADSSWEPVTPSGGGVQAVTVPVSSAQILDLFNTPVVIVAVDTGFAAVVTGVAVAYVAGGTPYTDNGGEIYVGFAGLPGGVIGVIGAGFWDQATDQLSMQGYGVPFGPAPSAGQDGVDVVLFNDTANPTLGDGTLLVTLSYVLAPTV